MKSRIVECDKKGNVTHVKFLKIDYEYWREVDGKNRCIHYRNSDGSDVWSEYGEYDEYDEIVYHKNDDGKEDWYKVIIGRKKTKITKEEFENLKEQEFLNRKSVSRFEVMEI